MVGEILAANPLAADQNVRVVEVVHGEQSSVSLVQIRDREQPHLHTRYDLTVMLIEGHGVLWLDNVPQPMRAGDISFVAPLIDGIDGLGALGTGAHAPEERVNLNALQMQTERTAMLLERLSRQTSASFSRKPASE